MLQTVSLIFSLLPTIADALKTLEGIFPGSGAAKLEVVRAILVAAVTAKDDLVSGNVAGTLSVLEAAIASVHGLTSPAAPAAVAVAATAPAAVEAAPASAVASTFAEFAG